MKLSLIILGQIMLGIMAVFMIKRKNKQIKVHPILYSGSKPVTSYSDFIKLDKKLQEGWIWYQKKEGFIEWKRE